MFLPFNAKRFLAFFVFLTLNSQCFTLNSAQADFGTTAANFLNIGVGSRIAAMGDAGSALIRDANVVYWNPSAVAFLESPDLQSTYLNMLSDIHFSQIGFVRPLAVGSLGFSGALLYAGELDGRNELDLPTKNFSFYNWAYSISYARKVSERSSAGLSLKIIREAIGGNIADGAAFDFGFTQQRKGLGLPDNLTNFAFVLQHLGPDLGPGKSSPLPFTARFGMSNALFSGRWTSAVDLAVPSRGDAELNFGNEWQIHPAFALRAGYRFLRSNSRDTDWFKFFTGGFGFFFTPPSAKQRYNLDYAFSVFANTGFNHRFSFGIKFL